jgi:hypothetical protein
MAIRPDFVRRLARECPIITVQDEVVSVTALEAAYRAGFSDCLSMYGVYKDGQQVIGCMERPIKQIIAEYADMPVPHWPG